MFLGRAGKTVGEVIVLIKMGTKKNKKREIFICHYAADAAGGASGMAAAGAAAGGGRGGTDRRQTAGESKSQTKVCSY